MTRLRSFATRLVAGLALAAVMMVVAGAGPAAAADKLRFVMPTGPATYLLPFFVAQDLGWYKEWGLEVEEKVVTGDANSLRVLIAGDADVTVLGPNTVMNGIIKGAPVTVISSWQPVTDYHVITRPEVGSSIKDLGDKKWASFSTGGMSAEIPKMVMRKYGLDPRDATFLSVGGMSSRMQAVVAKKVEVTMVDTFFTAIGMQQGLIEVASIAKEFPGLGYLYSVATKKSVADPPLRKSLKIFVRGGIEGVRLIQKDPDKAAEIMKNRTPTVDMALIKQIIPSLNDQGVWGTNGGLGREVTEFSSKTYHSLGAISRPITYEEIVDRSLVDEVIKDLGMM